MTETPSTATPTFDLLTYVGDDPFLILEPACHHCHVKESEKALSNCPLCLAVSYCSDDCKSKDSDRHKDLCTKIVESKETIASEERSLRLKYKVEDVYEKLRQVDSKAPFKAYVNANCNLAGKLFEVAHQGETKALWEKALETHVKFASFQPSSGGDVGLFIPYILLRLNRLDDAFSFLRNTMLCKKKDRQALNLRDLCHGLPGCRFDDCASWTSYVYSNYSRIDKMGDTSLVLCLLILKMRVRVEAAREAWTHTIDNVFLETKQGKQLEPVASLLKEFFSYPDEHVQMDQIRSLIKVIHESNPFIIPCLLDLPVESEVFAQAVSRIVKDWFKETRTITCLERTPGARDLLLEEVERMKAQSDGSAAGISGQTLCREVAGDFLRKVRWDFWRFLIELAKLIIQWCILWYLPNYRIIRVPVLVIWFIYVTFKWFWQFLSFVL